MVNNDKTYVFIDSQNLNLSLKNDIKNRTGKLIYKGWQLDYQKLYIYLKDKYKITKAYIFIGKVKGNEDLYNNLKSFGYDLIFKPTIATKSGQKGNVDAEIVLYASKVFYKKYNKGIFISGDGDFYCLYKELVNDKKLFKILIPNRHCESRLLKKFQKYKIFLENKKRLLEYSSNKNGGRRV